MMVFAGNAMERIVNPDSNAEVTLNTIEAWNESHLTPEELRELEFSRAPHPILESRCKSKWDIPKDGALDQFTIHDLLPGSSLSTLQKSTGTVLRLYNCGLATWIGAASEDKISLAKKKLNTLVKYFVSLIDEIFNFSNINFIMIGVPTCTETWALLQLRRSSWLDRRVQILEQRE